MSVLYRKSEEKHLHYVGGSAMGVPCEQCGATLIWVVPVELCEHGRYDPHDYTQPHSCSRSGCRTVEDCDGAITDE